MTRAPTCKVCGEELTIEQALFYNICESCLTKRVYGGKE